MNDQEFVNLMAKRLEGRLARAVNPPPDEQEEVSRRRARRRQKKSGVFKHHSSKKYINPRFRKKDRS